MSSGTAPAMATASAPGTACSRSRRRVANQRAPDASTRRSVRSYAASSTPSRRNPGSVSRLDEAAEEETRGEEHHDRERNFERHQRVAHPAAPGRADAAAQDLLRVEPRELQGRPEAKDDAAGNPERHCKGETHAVDVG